jgi:hypothetical protein
VISEKNQLNWDLEDQVDIYSEYLLQILHQSHFLNLPAIATEIRVTLF